MKIRINDIISFHDDSVTELRIAFEEAVEDYLQFQGAHNGNRY